MCLYSVSDDKVVQVEGEAYRVMRENGKTGDLHSIIFEPSRKYAMGIEYYATDPSWVFATRGGGQRYLTGFHCWQDLVVAKTMCALFESCRAQTDLKRYVVVLVKYKVRHAIGEDNPFACVADFQYPAVVVNRMTIVKKVDTAIDPRKVMTIHDLHDSISKLREEKS